MAKNSILFFLHATLNKTLAGRKGKDREREGGEGKEGERGKEREGKGYRIGRERGGGERKKKKAMRKK